MSGCYTCGDSLIDAMELAEDALALMLAGTEKEGREFPAATPVRQVTVDENSFVTLICCDTTNYPVTECASVHDK